MGIIKDGGEFSLRVSSCRTAHAELFSAFEYGDVLTYELTVNDGALTESNFLYLRRDDDGEVFFIPGFRRDGRCVFTLHTDEICSDVQKRGLFFCAFELGGRTVSINEFGPGFIVGGENDPSCRFQLSVYAPGTNRPTGYEGGIIYQIFPDRFCRGERRFSKEGAVMEEDWYAQVSEYPGRPGKPLKNNHFFGGTLYGVADKLDYLHSLGVTLIYLNPIFKAASNHRYDTGDYMTVDELLGGEEALAYLLEKCRAYGIGVILDGVFNHTGSDSLYFNKYGSYPSLGAYESRESPYFDWYYFKHYPESYECWWGIDILPKLNSGLPAVRDFIAGENGVLAKYTKMGVAGWRLDVADELPDVMLDDVHARVKKIDARAPVFGEVWEDASNKTAYSARRHYFTGGQLDAVMNYPLKNALISYLVTGDAEYLFFTVRMLYRHYPKAASDLQMNLLGSHDTPRILNMLAGDPHKGMPNDELAHARLSFEDRRRAKTLLGLAVLMQMTLPGMPCIYYGDEAGAEGDRDPFNRQTFKWGEEDGEILEVYRRCIALRQSLPMLANAFYKGLAYRGGVYSYERFTDTERLTVYVNLSGGPVKITVSGRMIYPYEKEIAQEQIIENMQACCVYEKLAQ